MEIRIVGLVLLTCVLTAPDSLAQYASAVAGYNAGTGADVGYTDPSVALGEPSRFTNDPLFPAPVDPFSSPYLPSQIVSIGTGGSLTLQMSTPVRNDASHPFGLDFIIYGNAGFGYGEFQKADGSFYGAASPGASRISVSADGTQFYALESSLAPVVDRYFPTDGAGLFGRAVNPSLANPSSFNGLDLDQIRALYNGSAGGAGFDLAWARDAGGAAVSLNEINFVRVEVLSDNLEIDGIAAVPEPSTWALIGLGTATLLIRKRRS